MLVLLEIYNFLTTLDSDFKVEDIDFEGIQVQARNEYLEIDNYGMYKKFLVDIQNGAPIKLIYNIIHSVAGQSQPLSNLSQEDIDQTFYFLVRWDCADAIKKFLTLVKPSIQMMQKGLRIATSEHFANTIDVLLAIPDEFGLNNSQIISRFFYRAISIGQTEFVRKFIMMAESKQKQLSIDTPSLISWLQRAIKYSSRAAEVIEVILECVLKDTSELDGKDVFQILEATAIAVVEKGDLDLMNLIQSKLDSQSTKNKIFISAAKSGDLELIPTLVNEVEPKVRHDGLDVYSGTDVNVVNILLNGCYETNTYTDINTYPPDCIASLTRCLNKLASFDSFHAKEIHKSLRRAERAISLGCSRKEVKKYLFDQKPIIERHLAALERSSKTTTFKNYVSTLLSCVTALSLLGLPLSVYLWSKNLEQRGSRFMFYNGQAKQTAETAKYMLAESLVTSSP